MKNTMHSFIIPSIDLLDGKIVRLYKGDYNQKTVYNVNLDSLLAKYSGFENLHIVDLNGARGENLVNLELISQIRRQFQGKIQFGGGVRTLQIAKMLLEDCKLDKIVLGTIAITNFALTSQIIQEFSKDKVTLALDCKLENGEYFPKTNGWKENFPKNLFQILEDYKNIAQNILVTDIAVDGTMQGANLELYRQIKQQFPDFLLQASGGVSSLADVENLQKVADFSIVGKALYEGLIDNL